MAKKTFAADGGGSKIYDCPEIDKGGIKQIDLLFKTHLDLGFTDFAAEVERKYYKIYIPQALRLAKQLRERGDKRFVWTIGSYLVYGYLQQANEDEKRLMEEAIAHGDISWHALPLTTHTELMDESLMEYGISISKRLDAAYGKHTTAAKMTDVPGHTIGMLPVLARNGIEFLHIGVNPASGVPEVPDVFRWQDGDGHEVVVMYAKNDYGDTRVVDGCDTAVAFAHTGDNHGPQNVEEILAVYDALESRYPGVKVQSCGLNEYAQKVLAVKDRLPVVTGEIGDTWIYGVGTDPKKVSGYRAMLRLRNQWIADSRLQPGTDAFEGFSRNLLCVPEHTWGMARFILNDYTNYAKPQLRALRETDLCKRVEKSWQEQRDYVTNAISYLPDDLRTEAEQELKKLKAVHPSVDGYSELHAGEMLEANKLLLGFDSRTGAINYMKKQGSAYFLASPDHPIGEFMYEIFSNDDFARFTRRYLKNLRTTRDWSIPTFTKPGVPNSIPHLEEKAERAEVWYKKTDDGLSVIVKLQMANMLTETYGCPHCISLEYFFPAGEEKLQLRLTWTHKDANRFTEAIWLRMNPRVKNPHGWVMDKIARMVSPYDVIKGGNRHLHAVKTGLYYDQPDGHCAIRSLDAPLVGMGAPAVVYFNRLQPSLDKGFYFNLYNNQWNTNFTYWYEDDAVFRFELEL